MAASNLREDARLLPKEDNSTMATSCQVSYSEHDDRLTSFRPCSTCIRPSTCMQYRR